MTPAIYNFTVYQGTTQSVPMQWLSNATPVNLTGAVIEMHVRPTARSREILDTLTTSNSRIVITNAAEGRFTLKFLPASLAGARWPQAVYDVRVTLGADVYRFVQGTLTLEPGVTRD